MNLKKIIALTITLVIGTVAFAGCEKTNNNTLNKEKAKVENTEKENNKKENTEKNNTQNKDSEENIGKEDGESEKVGESDTDSDKNDSTKDKDEPIKKYDSVAKIEPLTFGANVTVTCKDPEVAAYRVHSEIDGNVEPIQEDKAPIGEAALIFPAKEGQEVIIIFFDANGAFLGESRTTLVI
ncbi:hypothetical protein [Oceanirhabdus sp. W0125-5]|uniref:hypothetical protein n=1 Tax=Oceanirhabdus sp. W0125-5 TaxID=2999116 RepID=UPI0022F2D22C|nr:hypothetical protein [Oceanirhabdus sp. W0125-5]WBW97295.1 hypothetical protein OW730_00130 [Oceanirhabdus sp. W0125-5]